MPLINTTSRLAAIFTSMANGIKSLFKKIGSWFKKKPPQKPQEEATIPLPTGLDHDPAYHNYVKKIEGMQDIFNSLGLTRRIHAPYENVYEMGRRDGALGANVSSAGDIARAAAQALFVHISVILRGKLNTVMAQLHVAQNILKDDENSYKREQAHYDYVRYQYRYFPRNYSYLLFILYGVFGLALIIADMPLALKLIQDGFNMNKAPGALSIGNLLNGNIGKVIAANWETVFTAVGIALCTVYIKIYYDEFVGSPYANKVMTFNKFIEENGYDQSLEIKNELNKEYRRKNTAKTVLLILTLISILSLAAFRLATAKKLGLLEVNFFSSAAFICITLLFPVVGGICLSYSLNNLQNMQRLTAGRRKCKASRKKMQEAVESFTTIKKEYEDVDAAYQHFSDERKVVEEYTTYLMAFYKRGYVIGGMQPEKYVKGEDFYSRVLEGRNMATARKMNYQISKVN